MTLLLFRIILECSVSSLNDITEEKDSSVAEVELELEDCSDTELKLVDCPDTELELQDCSTESGFRRPAMVFTAALLVEIYCCGMDGFCHLNTLRFGKNHFLNEYWIYSIIKELRSRTH